MRESCCLQSQTYRGITMQELIEEYRQQLAELERRRAELANSKTKLRGAPYFLLLRRIDAIEQEIIELNCVLAWMVKRYGEDS